MGGLDVPTGGWRMSIAGFDLRTHAYMTAGIRELRHTIRKRRENTLMPQRDGKRGNEAPLDEIIASLRMTFFGDADRAGDPFAGNDEQVGLDDNLTYFIENVVLAPQDEFGCVEAIIIDPNDDMYTFRIQVDDFIPGDETEDGPIACAAVLTVRVPSGRVTAEAGS